MIAEGISKQFQSLSRVKLVRLVGMMLVVYVKETHLQHVKDIQSEHVGTGIMGKLGNKGGVGVSLRFHASELCFVNSHLAAHQVNKNYYVVRNAGCARCRYRGFLKNRHPCFELSHSIESSLRSLSTL